MRHGSSPCINFNHSIGAAMNEFLDYFFMGLTVVGAIPVFKSGFTGVLSWDRSRRIIALEKEKKFLIRLAGSDREYIGWLIHSVLLILVLFSLALMLRVLEIGPGMPPGVVAFIHWLLGGMAYFFAVATLGAYHRVRRLDYAIIKIDKKIASLTRVSKPRKASF